jgi:hypothetical protein
MKKVLLISFRIILLLVMAGALFIALAINATSHSSSRTENYPLWTIFMVSLLFFLFSFLFNRKTGKDLFD